MYELRAGVQFVQPLDAAIRAGKSPAMIAVLVNGLDASFYCDSMDGKWPVDSVIVKELIPHIDQNFRTLPTRDSRGIATASFLPHTNKGLVVPSFWGLENLPTARWSGAKTSLI